MGRDTSNKDHSSDTLTDQTDEVMQHESEVHPLINIRSLRCPTAVEATWTQT